MLLTNSVVKRSPQSKGHAESTIMYTTLEAGIVSPLGSLTIRVIVFFHQILLVFALNSFLYGLLHNSCYDAPVNRHVKICRKYCKMSSRYFQNHFYQQGWFWRWCKNTFWTMGMIIHWSSFIEIPFKQTAYEVVGKILKRTVLSNILHTIHKLSLIIYEKLWEQSYLSVLIVDQTFKNLKVFGMFLRDISLQIKNVPCLICLMCLF